MEKRFIITKSQLKRLVIKANGMVTEADIFNKWQRHIRNSIKEAYDKYVDECYGNEATPNSFQSFYKRVI